MFFFFNFPLCDIQKPPQTKSMHVPCLLYYYCFKTCHEPTCPCHQCTYTYEYRYLFYSLKTVIVFYFISFRLSLSNLQFIYNRKSPPPIALYCTLWNLHSIKEQGYNIARADDTKSRTIILLFANIIIYNQSIIR